jgi:peptide/nickel transport system substrate-binding protein
MNTYRRVVAIPLLVIATTVSAGMFPQINGVKDASAAHSRAVVGSIAAQTSNCLKIGGIEDSGQKNSLDPGNQPSTQNSLMVNAMYNRLMDLDDKYLVHPELATKWSSNKAGTVWTFHLRKGVKFSDGHPFTAADVVWTYRRLIDPNTKSEAAATLAFLTSSGIIAKDKYTVVFKLDKPVAELPVDITTKNTYIVEKGLNTDQLRTRGVGTGPFVPVGFQPVQQVHLFVRNKNYWQKGLPKSPCLAFYVIQEATTRNAALESGQIDIAQQIDFSTIPTMKSVKSVKLLKTGPSTSMTLPMWVDTPPFNDNRVREALKLVVDRKQMIATVLNGYGLAGDDNPIPPNSRFAWRHTAPKKDIPRAKKLLAAAGYTASHPLKVDLYTAEMIPGAVAMAQVYKQQAAMAGVDVNVIVGPASEYWDNVWLKHPFEMSGWNARPPGEGLSIAYRCNAAYPETHWCNKKYDALLDRATTTVNAKKRLALYQEVTKMLSLQGGEIIPAFVYTVAAERAGCTGYKPRVQLYRADFRFAHCSH